MLFDEGIDLFFGQAREDFDVAFGLFIAHVEPELVEGVRCGAMAVEPHVALFRFAEFLAVGLVMRGQVRAKASFSPPSLRRISSEPVVMLPHWSLPPICKRQPFVS